MTKIWWIMAGLGLGTFLIRFSFIALYGKIQFPPLVEKSLKFIPAAVLFSLISPQFLMVNSYPNLTLANPRLIAGTAAAFVSWRTKNVALTIICGMAVLYLMQMILPIWQ
jgi:branched-subunit amino acid transport protein